MYTHAHKPTSTHSTPSPPQKEGERKREEGKGRGEKKDKKGKTKGGQKKKKKGHSRQLPRNIILRTQPLPPLLQTPKIPRRHHPRPIPRRSRYTKRSRDLDIAPRKHILPLIALKTSGVRSPQRKLSSLDVLHPHPLPIEQIAEALRAVALVDALAARFGGELGHEVRELVDGVVDAFGAAVDDVDAVVGGVLDQLLHVAAEARQVRRDGRHAHDGALGGGVAPGLVVGREDAEVGAAHELVVVEGQHRVGGIQKLGVEDDLDAVGRVVEELHAPDLVEDRVLGVVGHVVRDDGGQAVALHGEEAAPEEDAVLRGDEVLGVGHGVAVVPFEGALEDALAHAALDHVDGVAEGLDDGLALEGFDGEGLRLRGHDDECHDGHFGAGGFEAVVQAREGLDEHVAALVPVLVPAGREEVQRVIRVEVVVAVEVAAHEVVDLLLGLLVQVLELVHGAELCDVEAVGEHAVGLALEQVLALVGRDVRDGREDVARVRGRALDAVAVVDAALARLGVHVKVLQVVVEVDGAGAEVAPEQRRVRREDGRHVDAALLAEGQGDTREPFVEVGDDGLFLLVRDELSQEPRDEVSKHHRLVGLVVTRRRRDAGRVPQIRLPLVQELVCSLCVDQQDARGTLDQPAPIDDADAALLHGGDGGSESGIRRRQRLDLDSSLDLLVARSFKYYFWGLGFLGLLTDCRFSGPIRV